jgi:hypothetical protein
MTLLLLLIAAFTIPSLAYNVPRQASTITVDLTKTYQTMSGFGISETWYAGPVQSPIALVP